MLLDKPSVGQRIHVLGRGQPGHLEVALHEFDLGVGVREQIVDQVLTVELEAGADAVLVVEQRRLDGVNGCLLYTSRCV